MIKKWLLAGLLLGAAGVCASAQQAASGEAAHRHSAQGISVRLHQDAKRAVLNFRSSLETAAIASNRFHRTGSPIVQNGAADVAADMPVEQARGVLLSSGAASNTVWLFCEGARLFAGRFVFSGIWAVAAQKTGSGAAKDNPLPFNVALVFGNTGGKALQVWYTRSY